MAYLNYYMRSKNRKRMDFPQVTITMKIEQSFNTNYLRQICDISVGLTWIYNKKLLRLVVHNLVSLKLLLKFQSDKMTTSLLALVFIFFQKCWFLVISFIINLFFLSIYESKASLGLGWAVQNTHF